MAEITDSLPGIAPVLPMPTAPLSALKVTNPVVAREHDTRPSEAEGIAADSSLDQALTTPYLIQKINISNTDVIGDPMLLAIDPFRQFVASPLVQARCVGKRFIRGTLVVTANMVVPGSAIGAYNLQALCCGGLRVNAAEEIDGISGDTVWTSFQDHFALMNVEMQNSVSLELPFEYPVNALEVVNALTIDAMIWRIQLYCLTPLQSTITTTASGTINVYAHFKPDVKLMVNKYQSSRFPVPAKGKQGAVGSLASKLGTAAATVSTMIPSIAPYAAPVAIGFKALASVADIFGFTRDADPKVPDPYVHRLTSNMVVVDGPDISEPLGLSTTNTVTVDSSLTGGESDDMMSFSSLFARWTLTDSLTITSSSVGKVYSMSCSPFRGRVKGNLAYFPVAGYVGLPFNFWTGSLEYLIYIPSHQNIKGMIQVFWAAQDPALPNDPTPYLKGTMIDLSGSSSTLIRVDMAPKCPSRKVIPYTNAVVSAPTEAANGYLVFYMPNVITSPKTTQTLNIHILVRACSNMRFHNARTIWCPANASTVARPMTACMRYESKDMEHGEDNVDPNVSQDPPTTLCPGVDFPVIALNYGEEIASVRAMIQKFSYVGTGVLGLSTAVGSPPNMCVVSFPPPVAQEGTTLYSGSIAPLAANVLSLDPWLGSLRVVRPWTYSAHYLAMFNGYRGSFRLKAIPRLGASTAVGQTLPSVSLGFSALSTMEAETLATTYIDGSMWSWKDIPFSSNVQYMPFTPGVNCPEVHVPFSSPLPLVPTVSKLARHNNTFAVDVTGLLTNDACLITLRTNDLFAGTTDKTVTFDVHTAAGPDCTVGHFYRTPGVRINALVP